MFSPKKNEIKVPKTRKGPKGTSESIFLFFKATNPIPIIAPINEAKNRAVNMSGNPKKKPIKTTSLTSPNPSHFPFEKNQMKKKKKVGIKTAKIFNKSSSFINENNNQRRKAKKKIKKIKIEMKINN